MQVKPDQDTLIIKTNVFEVPREVWRSGFNAFQMESGAESIITFSDYARQRDNPDFVRDFNLACSRQPHLTLVNTSTGDLAQVNKGFLDSMSLLDPDSVNGGEDAEESKFAFLASDDQLNADGTDFSDPAALLRRQRKILEQIEQHQAKQNANFDPLKLLRRTSSSQTEQSSSGAQQAASDHEETKTGP